LRLLRNGGSRQPRSPAQARQALPNSVLLRESRPAPAYIFQPRMKQTFRGVGSGTAGATTSPCA
jgi:hypothetical protein